MVYVLRLDISVAENTSASVTVGVYTSEEMLEKAIEQCKAAVKKGLYGEYLTVELFVSQRQKLMGCQKNALFRRKRV